MTSLAPAPLLPHATPTVAPGPMAPAPAAAGQTAASALSTSSAASAASTTSNVSTTATGDAPGTPDPAAQRLAHLFRRVSASQVPPELQRALYAHRGVAP
ncbi:hypothetical protein [Acidovorax sp. RAC01]|uniref:hypothetical protein n=1 Tax=Acidovorax sp. RAC01 TaxID=1842533 RepID=UPI0008591386|nr:hypothetical protein [Acidovorax sp. RAC01]AOG25300.1 hypothetical protein BSY15_264 [Acidovorax sp. RAC01]